MRRKCIISLRNHYKLRQDGYFGQIESLLIIFLFVLIVSWFCFVVSLIEVNLIILCAEKQHEPYLNW